MQICKPLVQILHLLALRPRIIALLPVPRLLMLPLLHTLRRRRSDNKHIRRATQKRRQQWRQHMQSVAFL